MLCSSSYLFDSLVFIQLYCFPEFPAFAWFVKALCKLGFLKVLYKSKVKQINKRNIFHKEHPKLWKHADSTEAEGVDRSSGDSAESAARRV